MVKLLLRHGARTDCKNDDGETPIDIAEEKGDEKTLNELAKSGSFK